MPQTIYAMATMDTKAEELCFVANCIRRDGLQVVLVDLSTMGASERADVSARTVAEAHPDGAEAVLGHTDRGQAVAAMAVALRKWLVDQADSNQVSGVIALGGSGGTAIVAPGMQARAKYDQYGHLTRLIQQGWDIRYSKYQGVNGIGASINKYVHCCGWGFCGTCRVRIVSGMDHTSSPSVRRSALILPPPLLSALTITRC